MWQQITLYRDDRGNRSREVNLIECNLCDIKLLIALQDLTNVQAMYIMNLDTDQTDTVKIYQIQQLHKGGIRFRPMAISDTTLNKFFDSDQTKAMINLTLWTDPKAAKRLDKLLKESN